jgi:hypothetical protein
LQLHLWLLSESFGHLKMDEEYLASGAISYQFGGVMINHMTAASTQSMRINTVAFCSSICYATLVFFLFLSK